MASSQFETTVFLCKGKSTIRTRFGEESAARVRLLRRPKESVQCASPELAMPVTTVWKVLCKRLELHSYRLQLLQALKPTGYGLRDKFANDMLIHAHENLIDYIVFSDESTRFTSVDM
ncbi:DUF4817 domain-containing protein [Trichonephila clavipes]|nr:DUF4817 domain-containing protein [Trichonephila clavipes]